MTAPADSGPATGERCPVCHHPVALIWVHSHLQCPTCKTVVQPCCTGERADEREGTAE